MISLNNFKKNDILHLIDVDDIGWVFVYAGGDGLLSFATMSYDNTTNAPDYFSCSTSGYNVICELNEAKTLEYATIEQCNKFINEIDNRINLYKDISTQKHLIHMKEVITEYIKQSLNKYANDQVNQMKLALDLIHIAHENQTDKAGNPYTEHLERVAFNAQKNTDLEPNKAFICGLLHDIIEDTQYTADDLRNFKFDDDVVDAVITMTHDKDVAYHDYIINISKNEISKQVKIADLEDNMNITRLKSFSVQKDGQRLKKYFYSYKFLIGEITEQEYIKIMNSL